MKVAIVNYGMGNLGSVRRALEELKAEVFIAESPSDLAHADKIVLPGVGSFAEGASKLRSCGWSDAIPREIESGKTLLGICLGMQLLADMGFEGGANPGLGLISGRVVRLDQLSCNLRIPHVGWNSIHPHADSLLFRNITDQSDFYFVHSFAFDPENPADVAATTQYGMQFTAAVNRGNIMGTQFHPEKSSRAGFRLLKNFLELPTC